MKKINIVPIIQAFLAALLFGASAPVSKVLLGEVDPIFLAAFLYLGSGLGLLLYRLGFNRKGNSAEAPIQKSDIGWLSGAIIAGGIAAPIVLLFSLRDTPGATASLLLNFEGVATTLIAAMVFREAVSRRAWWAIILVTMASILLSVDLRQGWGLSWGSLGILAACIMWGIDNNFTRNISDKNPISIVTIKGLVAGSFSLFLALILGNELPAWSTIFKALLLGSLSYGMSITLFILAMRGMGAARTSALFGTSPLAGVVLSIILLGESINLIFLEALVLMAAGAVLLIYEDHQHTHIHQGISHEYFHRHDDGHHDHIHDEEVKAHSHWHKHKKMEHTHQHTPDIHHRHSHS